MEFNCPHCKGSFDLLALATESDHQELLKILFEVRYWKEAQPYLQLFCPEKSRRLSSNRLNTLLKELIALQNNLAVNNKIMAKCLELTHQTMLNKIADRSFRKLTNHNYLKRIIECELLNPSTNSSIATKNQTSKTSPRTPAGTTTRKAQFFHEALK